MLNLILATALTSSAAACPQQVTEHLDDLYRWHLAAQAEQQRGDLTLQKQTFTPELYDQLDRAWDLDPRVDGAFLDFVVFSGTQVSTFGAEVIGCHKLYPAVNAWSPEVITASVAVRAGLRGRASEIPQQLSYRLIRSDNGWVISDLVYNHQNGTSSSLSELLRSILSSASSGR